MSVSRPRTTPCIGRCSHNVGDDICKGCNRTIAEVRDWNTYTPDEKVQKMKDLTVRGRNYTPHKPATIPLISWDDL